MQGGLANLAVILVFTVLFFVLLTQRMMITNDLAGFKLSDKRVGLSNITEITLSHMISKHDNVQTESVLATTVPGTSIKFQANQPGSKSEERGNVTHLQHPLRTQPPLTTSKESSFTNIKFLDSLVTPLKTGTVSKEEDRKTKEFNEIETVNNHPYQSPRAGTDISIQHHTSLLLCPNQSKCIVPELQLQKKYKIYLCKHPVRQGVRFYFLAREGLLLHPNVELLTEDSMNDADYFVYLPGSAPWHKTECNDPKFASRMIVLDEFDGHSLVSPTMNSTEFKQAYGKVDAVWYYAYFKRSFVRRNDGKFLGYPHLVRPDTFPMTYAIAEAYIPHMFNQKREMEISCTLRGSKHMTTRLRVQEWVAEYGKVRNVQNIIASQVDTKDRITISLKYFQQMFNTQIIVTVNPANWEGDFRLWEAMGTGALIFVDPVFVPHQFPLLDGVHVAYFSNTNKTELFEKLDYYRNNPLERIRVATQGYLHAMKYHRTVNLIDYVLRTTHYKEALAANKITPSVKIPRYSYTGQYLNREAGLQEPMIKECHYPGVYQDPMHSDYSNSSTSIQRLQCAKKLRKNSNSNIAFME